MSKSHELLEENLVSNTEKIKKSISNAISIFKDQSIIDGLTRKGKLPLVEEKPHKSDSLFSFLRRSGLNAESLLSDENEDKHKFKNRC